MSGKTYSYNGNEYSLRQLAQLTGIHENTLWGRMTRGLSVDQAIDFEPGNKIKLYSYHGEMLSIKQIAAKSKISWQGIVNRLHRGWSIEDAADLPIGAMAKAHYKKRDKQPAWRPAENAPAVEHERFNAALNIFKQIGSEPAAWNFRCIEAARVYAFESDLLKWNIRFTPDGKMAYLGAHYKEHGFDSDFKRAFYVIKDKVQEVEIA